MVCDLCHLPAAGDVAHDRNASCRLCVDATTFQKPMPPPKCSTRGSWSLLGRNQPSREPPNGAVSSTAVRATRGASRDVRSRRRRVQVPSPPRSFAPISLSVKCAVSGSRPECGVPRSCSLFGALGSARRSLLETHDRFSDGG